STGDVVELLRLSCIFDSVRPGTEVDPITPKHYVNILSKLIVRAPVPAQWKKYVVDDLTSGGQLALETLPTNKRGEAFGIRREHFLCMAVEDRLRPDTIFIFSVRPSTSQPVQGKLHYYSVELSLVDRASETLPQLDPIRPLVELVSSYSSLRVTTQPGDKTQ